MDRKFDPAICDFCSFVMLNSKGEDVCRKEEEGYYDPTRNEFLKKLDALPESRCPLKGKQT